LEGCADLLVDNFMRNMQKNGLIVDVWYAWFFKEIEVTIHRWSFWICFNRNRPTFICRGWRYKMSLCEIFLSKNS